MVFISKNSRMVLIATMFMVSFFIVSCGDRLAQSGWSTGAIGILSDSTYAVFSQYSEVWEERRINIFGDAYDHTYHKQIKITVKNIDTREIYWEKEFPWSGSVNGYYLADSTFILEDTNILFWTVGDEQPRKSEVTFNEVEGHINLSAANLQRKGDSILAFLPDEFIFIDTASGKVGEVSESEIPAWMRECENVVYRQNNYLCIEVLFTRNQTRLILINRNEDTLSNIAYSSEFTELMSSLTFSHGNYYVLKAYPSEYTELMSSGYALISWNTNNSLAEKPSLFVQDFKRDGVYRDFNADSYE